MILHHYRLPILICSSPLIGTKDVSTPLLEISIGLNMLKIPVRMQEMALAGQFITAAVRQLIHKPKPFLLSLIVTKAQPLPLLLVNNV